MVKGMGGGMDLVAGARRTVVMMDHATKDGKPKILEACTLPLTGKRCVAAICSDRAWLDVTPTGLLLRELAPGETVASVQALTGPKLAVAADLTTMSV
jgi:3-oxoacid CoA-transferase subunit B